MEEMLVKLGLQDCFEDTENVLEITDEQILQLRLSIDRKVRQNEVALNRSVDMVSAGYAIGEEV